MILTSDQQRAFDKISTSRSQVITLGGHSGTGKTSLIPMICQHALDQVKQERTHQQGHFSAFDDLDDEALPVVVTAPTNKAAKVIRAKLREAGLGRVPCYTIHKANGLTMANDKEEKYLVRSGEGLLQGTKLLIVDEASMVGERMFEMIVSKIVSQGIRVLFVGDPYQLPPVKDGQMQAFNPEQVPDQVMLEKVVRQVEGHPVIALGDFFRRKIQGKQAEIPPRTTVGATSGVIYLKMRDFYNQMVKEFVEYRHKPGAIRAIAWRNNTVNALAQQAREALYGKGVPRFITGECVFTARPFEEMHTDQECMIRQVHPPDKHPGYPEFEAIPLDTESIDTFNTLCQRGYAPTDPFKVQKEVERLRKRALHYQHLVNQGGSWKDKDQERLCWREFHQFQEAFVDIRSVHAMTAHRSQGSTFDSVFVDSQDIKSSSDKFRLLYVACTRARNRVYVRES